MSKRLLELVTRIKLRQGRDRKLIDSIGHDVVLAARIQERAEICDMIDEIFELGVCFTEKRKFEDSAVVTVTGTVLTEPGPGLILGYNESRELYRVRMQRTGARIMVPESCLRSID